LQSEICRESARSRMTHTKELAHFWSFFFSFQNGGHPILEHMGTRYADISNSLSNVFPVSNAKASIAKSQTLMRLSVCLSVVVAAVCTYVVWSVCVCVCVCVCVHL